MTSSFTPQFLIHVGQQDFLLCLGHRPFHCRFLFRTGDSVITFESIQKVVHEFGQFHDCRITSIQFVTEGNKLIVSIDDLNSAFEGFPEYSGPQPGHLVFERTNAISVKLSGASYHAITDTDVKQADGDTRLIFTGPNGFELTVATQSPLKIEFEG
jgi:hypothetical protein